MFHVIECQAGMAVPAERVECGLARVRQVVPLAPVAVDAACDTRVVDIVVMTGQAID